MIEQMGFRSLLLLLSYTITGIGLAAAGWQYCYETGNFTANSAYARNRNLILSSLASNVVKNGGFYTADAGQDPGKVYGRALCRGDASAEDCSRCVSSSSQDIMVQCPNQKEAYMWAGTPPCMVRYADHSFVGKLEMDVPVNKFYNEDNITSSLTEFDQIWQRLMDSTAKEASMGSSRLKFATQEENLTRFQTIYALMQCTPDLSQNDCYFCLRRYVAEYQNCCFGKQGGGVKSPNCMLRWDLYPFYKDISVAPLPSPLAPTNDSGGIAAGTLVTIVVSIIIFVVLVAFVCFILRKRKQKQIRSNQERRYDADEIDDEEALQFDFSTIRLATNDFNNEGKLGEGGFGAVYKGRLPNGQDIAVKRLSNNSGQGEAEFKNEVRLVARLQHRNLVKLLGFCFEGNEKLLVYEFVPNSSLDNFIFDPIKSSSLDWETRYKIIGGIARGLIYLHEDSRLRIIHRDLKASNILLDANMNPKISDFGMARLFAMNQTQGNTNRVVGTFGYMAPEYVKYGKFSIKSDVFSFGVLLLEIISGQKNSNFRIGKEAEDLLTYAWKNWKGGTALNLIDPTLSVGSSSDIVRCIHIGLLCVQENVASRPTMASVVLMLTSSSLALPLPSKPAFYIRTTKQPDSSQSTMSDQSTSSSVPFSMNDVSITQLDPR
ncbi:hypothetical protein ACOSQ3_012516 [Xanthoceras sorbifolium]